jgi:hypothetical protein
MSSKTFETSEFITFDTTYGDSQIQIDIPRKDFDLENCTVWLTTDQISDMCNATVSFVKASRLMSNNLFDDDKCVIYTKDANCKYNLSVSLMLIMEYAPTTANRFISFVTKKLCELYLENRLKGEITLKELPLKMKAITDEFEKSKKKNEDLEARLKQMSDDIESLKRTSQQSTYDVMKVLETQMQNETNTDADKLRRITENAMQKRLNQERFNDQVSDNEFFTVPDFMHLPSIQKLFLLKGISDQSRLFTMIKSVITTQANYCVRAEMSKALRISAYESSELFDKIMCSWKSDNPRPIGALVSFHAKEEIDKIIRYVKTYTFYRDGETKYNCLASYPYKLLRDAVKAAIQFNKFDEVLDTIKSVLATDDEIDNLIKQYVNT